MVDTTTNCNYTPFKKEPTLLIENYFNSAEQVSTFNFINWTHYIDWTGNSISFIN